MQLEGKVFITGGAGTLGKAILRRAHEENWDAQFTIYSTDPMKHKAIKEMYPDVTCVLGSVTDAESLLLAIAGHDVVIHAGAYKHIVQCEEYPLATIDVNVYGSQNVFGVCANLGIPHVVAISTDKACEPINSYGVSKMMMERICHAYAWEFPKTEFHLCRYGNVVGSTGSFIHNWRKDLHELGLVNSTVETMTRFWMSEDDAVNVILRCIEEPTGATLIPRPKTASIGDLEKWLLPEGTEVVHHGARPGEKKHETLLTESEGFRTEKVFFDDVAEDFDAADAYRLHPPGIEVHKVGLTPLRSSATHLKLTEEQAIELFGKVE